MSLLAILDGAARLSALRHCRRSHHALAQIARGRTANPAMRALRARIQFSRTSHPTPSFDHDMATKMSPLGVSGSVSTV
jgi:hypothetical protein